MRNRRNLLALAVVLAAQTAVGACSVLNRFDPLRDAEPSDPGGGGSGGTAGTGGSGGTGGTAGAGGSGGTLSRSCETSLDCGGEGVCGPELVCVDCVSAADCADDHSCVDYRCRPSCDSDRDCVSAGLLCDKSKAYCVECLSHAQCQEAQHCASGACRADLCVGGTRACRDGAVVECSAAGDGYGAPSACGSRQSCVESGGEASCSDWRCTAGAVECADNQVVTCSADGLRVLSAVSCRPEQVCAGGACQDRACVPSTRFCKADGVHDCAADGLSATLVTSCGGGQYCDDSGEATCKTGVCAPDEPACDGNAATVCNEAGAGYVSAGTPCGAEVCSGGVCKTPVCAALALKCQSEDLYECGPDRLSWTRKEDCASGSFCDDANPACKAWVCTPSQPACDGNAAKTCNGDGSGYLAGGAECTGGKCVGGQCKPLICTPSQRYCDGEAVRQCSADGLSSALVATCGVGQYCDAASATCQTGKCTPNQPLCIGNTAKKCNGNGSDYVSAGMDCGESLCVSGVCKTPACAAAERKCESDDVYECASDRLSWTLRQDCASGTYCDPVNPQCKTWACTPSQPACDGNTKTGCNANGSGYVAGGTPCGSDLCVSGVCRTPVCAAAERKCESEDVYECASDRLSWTRKQDCASGDYCDVASPACKARVCTPDAPACDGDRASTCNGNGSGYLAGGTDCVAAGKVCSAGSCVTAGTEGPSCAGLGAICGPGRDRSCCESSVVPGGTYNRSNNASYPATVSDFRLDTYEVTVGRFRRFVAGYTRGMLAAGAGKNPNNAADPGWDKAWDASLPADAAALKTAVQCDSTYQTWTSTAGANENKPMNCLSWYVAEAFCIWDGGRLPTEAEWNYAAAGGSEQRKYPWGLAEPGADAARAVHGCYYSGDSSCAVADVAPVGSAAAGNGRWGQADLAGNMWEWVQDWYGSYATTCHNCANLSNASFRVTRGGSLYDSKSLLLSSSRDNTFPLNRVSNSGARCVRSAP